MENILLDLTVQSALMSIGVYFIFSTLNNFIEKKWGIKPKNRIETMDIIIDRISKSFIEVVPVLKDFVTKYETPVPIPEPDIKIAKMLADQFSPAIAELKTEIESLKQIIGDTANESD